MLTNKPPPLIVGAMRDETQEIKIVPTKRTAATYRAVLQRFDPSTGRYVTLSSARMEAGPETDPAAVRAGWDAAVRLAFGADAGPEHDVVPIDNGAPLGSGCDLDGLDSEI